MANAASCRGLAVLPIREFEAGGHMIRVAVVIAIAASASACTSQANVPYSSKTTCTNHIVYGQIPGGALVPRNEDVCIPNTPYKSCLQYLDRRTGNAVVRCTPLTRKATTPEGRARQLAGSKYP
ncbi:hypothetical protein MPLDJ20_40047 [Mesorhizobium plurifarium]|uniref:Uncharacterized protein n=1 Tax=Mesorhizobium plurifarium TaxID=69974 RepID=A0A090FCN1_MESPL|nr:hypothetical protein MPLDJ20_40047 [Mesorhizobium plurifarium]